MKSVFIFRRDLRVYDNIGLIQCLKDSKEVYPIFIFTKEQLNKNDYRSENSVQFMIESLKELSKDIPLSFFYGDNLVILKKIITDKKINAIYVNEDYTPFSKKRDSDIEKLCKKKKIEFKSFTDILLKKPGIVLTGSKKVYEKFTPFYNKIKKMDIEKPSGVSIKSYDVKTLKNKYSYSVNDIKYKSNDKIFKNGGRKNGLSTLQKGSKLTDYSKKRDLLTYETTGLSAYLKFGCVSIREVYWKFKNAKLTNLVRQLFWREFYYHLGDANPRVFGNPLKEKYSKVKWVNNKKHFDAWKEGKTGFPIVDACMRELNTTGYMHNRGRLITASFLIKNLGINWLKGEKYFATKLVDYDPLVNNGNWQWVAGTGADSQPYFRIFNPWSQGKKFDKDAEYIKHWVPELKDMKAKDIHTWEKSYEKYENNKYFSPIIDYKKSREESLERYKPVFS